MKTLSKILIFTLLLQLMNISALTVNASATMSIADARAEAEGVEVTIEGVITHINGKNHFVQDDTAAIVVRTNENSTYNVGDKISVTGLTDEYYGMSQIAADVADVTLVQADAGVPAAQVISSTDLTSENGEEYEAELVTISDVSVSDVDTKSNYSATDTNGDFVIKSYDGYVAVGGSYTSVTGVIDYNYSEYKLTPRSSEDVVAEGSDETTLSIADARAEAEDVEVTIEGVITHISGKNHFVQDDTAAIVVRTNENSSYSVGDKIKATGTRAEYWGMSQISADNANITLVQADAELPAAQVISSTDLTSENGEAYEAELVTISDVSVSDVDTKSNYTATDADGNFVIKSYDGYVAVGGSYTSVTGVIDYNYSEYKLTPRSSDDVVGSGSEEVTLSTIADARENVGSEVLIEGIVTAGFDKGKMNYFVQDETAGIVVRVGGITLNIGDKISAKGVVKSYYGMQQLEPASADDVQVIEANTGVPEAKTVTSTDFAKENGDLIEGQFVKVINAIVGEANSYGEYTVTDANGTFLVKPSNDGTIETSKTYDVIYGVVDYSFGKFMLIPRDMMDAVEDYYGVVATPKEERVVVGTEVELLTHTENGTIYYTVDGSEPTTNSTVYSSPITINEDTTIKAFVVADTQTGSVYEFSYTALETLDGLSIHDIQGASHLSPYEGLPVTDVQGIITRVEKNGFYMQEPNADNDIRTSEGIYVYDKNTDVVVGDLVSVNGMVKEYSPKGYDDANDLLTTQISASAVTVISSGNDLPEAILIGKDGRIMPTVIIDNDGMSEFDPQEDGLDFYEALEGMLVSVKDGQVIAPPKYGEIAVYIDNGQQAIRTPSNGLLITPEDLNPERLLIFSEAMVKVGDRFDGTITGVITYTYSNFKLEPTEDMPAVIDGGYTQEVTDLVANADELTVAAYNVENYSAETSDEKTLKIAKSIINNLKNPDIIGLVEVQDNDGPTDSGVTDASASYQKLIDAIIAEGGPTYAFTEIAPEDKMDGGQPGGNIRVGFLYNVDRVSLSDKEAGTATTAVGADENGLTLNPGRIDPTNEIFESTRKSLAAEFVFNGEKVIVINNHFNSKRGDDALYGSKQPAQLGSETQRMELAKAVNGFVKEILSHNADANVVVLGDMNDFEFSNPLLTLEGNELTNMVKMLPKQERYTYVYQGNSQVLDHVLVSNNLVLGTKVDIVHLNAEFAEEHGRASDHDPVMVQVNFGEKKQTVVKSDGDENEGTVTVSDDKINELSYKGTLVVEVSEDASSLSFTKEQMTSLINKNGKVTVSNGSVEITFNANMFTAESFTLNFSELDEMDAALSGMYDLTIKSGDTDVTQFTAPITLSFTVDTDKVDNGDNVKVYYYDTTDKNWVLVGGTYANGVVTTTTDHFTTFAAFDSSKEQPILEEELPNTATNMYNMIAIGLVLTLLGGVLLYRKKQVA